MFGLCGVSDNESAAGNKRPGNLIQDRSWSIEFMIRVRNKDSIDCPGKVRIVRLSENRANVSPTLDEAANPQKCER